MFFLSSTKAIVDTGLHVFNSISELPLEVRAALQQSDRPHRRADYLEMLERKCVDTEFYYVLIEGEERPAGICYFQLVNFKGDDLAGYLPEPSLECNKFNYFFRKTIEWLRCAFQRMELKLLVSGNIFVTGDDGWIPLREDLRFDYLPFIREASLMIARERRDIRSILLSDLDQQTRDRHEFHAFSWLDMEPDMTMELRPEWASFDDYLASMSSKYRVRARKVLSVSEPVTEREFDADELALFASEMHCLYLNVVEKATFNLATLPEGYFAETKSALGDDFRVTGYFLRDKLVGFMCGFRNGDENELSFMGLDYRANRKYKLYQRMLYDVIRQDIEAGINRTQFGRTAQEIKSTIGARPSAVYGLLQHRNPVTNAFVKPLTDRMKPKAYVIRDPYK